MDKKRDLLGVLLALIFGFVMLMAMLIRGFLPSVILPKLDILALLLISLITLVLDFYLAKRSKRVYWLIPIYAFLIFGIFPWVACFLPLLTALKTSIIGAGVFTMSTFLFDSIINRLSNRPFAKLTPLITAFGLFLSAQCFMGIIK